MQITVHASRVGPSPPFADPRYTSRALRALVSMFSLIHARLLLFALLLLGSSVAQSPTADIKSSAKRGIALAQKGRCREALPILKRATHISDKQLEYATAMATARCSMSLHQTEAAVEALLRLNREFPREHAV